MKIVDIFADQLFSIVYLNNEGVYDLNEYDRLMELWTDVDYLRKYAKINKIPNPTRFTRERLADAEKIQDLIEELTSQNKRLEQYFQPLYDHEVGIKILSFQKGKIERNGLRLYAIKIDDNCFVITGGAIKMSQAMQDHPDSNEELNKIKKAKSWLQDQDIIDQDSFFEFLND
jgi:hypothetical protein